MLCVALCCSALFDGNQKFWEGNGTFLLFNPFMCKAQNIAPKFPMLCYVCTNFIRQRAGAHETLEMLDGMLDSFDHLSRAVPSKAE